jgi:hypothetical protein
MRPFFRYYGSKWSSIALYPRPQHGLIVEPFAGSASYSVWHEPARAILCDVDHYVAGVWDYLIRASAEEIRRIPILQEDQSVDDLGPVPQEARWLVGFWMNSNGTPDRHFSSRSRAHFLTKPGSIWSARTRDRIASQVDRIRAWEIRHADCLTALDDIGAATWFVDPPYRVMGRHYRFGSKLLDFQQLGQWCRRLPGQTIVCEAQGETWMPFRPLALTLSARTSRRTSAEAVWSSDAWTPAPTQLSLLEDTP